MVYMSPELVPAGLILFRNLRYIYIYIYIYIFKKRYTDLSSRNFSWWKKILFFYFCFIFFFGHPRHPPPEWKKQQQQQQQIILRGSWACRLVGNLVPRGKARRWLNLLHWWNGKRQQKHRWVPHMYYTGYRISKAAALKALGWLMLSHWWNSRRQQNYSFLVCFQTT